MGLATLLHQHLHAAPPQIRHRRPDISPDLNALVAQMLSKSVEDRPQSAREVLSRPNGSVLATPRPASATVDLPGRPSVSPSQAGTLLATTKRRPCSPPLNSRDSGRHQPRLGGCLQCKLLERMQALPVLATFAVHGVLAGVLFIGPDSGRSTAPMRGAFLRQWRPRLYPARLRCRPRSPTALPTCPP